MTRQEHLVWAKERANKEEAYSEVWASFMSDMSKHEELKDHTSLNMGMMLMMNGFMNTRAEVIDYVDGFN